MKKTISTLLVLLSLTLAVKSQTILTVSQVYDFNINDEFHYKWVESPPNADRIKIIDKYYSVMNDTVFYVRDLNNYYTEVNWQHLDYFYHSLVDTVYYTNLDSLIFKPDSSMTSDSTGGFVDTLYYSTLYCGRLIYQYGFWAYFMPSYSWSYGQGLGLVQERNLFPGDPPYDYN